MGSRLPALLLAAFAVPALAATEPAIRQIPTLTEAGAQSLLQEAERLAREAKDPAAIAVVDTDGLLLGFIRMDGTRAGSIDLAIGKGRVALATAGLTALRGGAPLKAGGVVVGGIGIASLKKDDDSATATAVAAKDLAAP